MFRATIFPILRSIRLYTIACGMLYPIRCRSVIWWPDYPPAMYWVQYNISQAVVYSLMLLSMGKIVARNMSS